MRPRQLLDYLTMALIWSFSFILLYNVVHAFGWIGAVTFRAFTASALLLGFARVTGRRLRFGDARPLALVGATTVAGQLVGLSFASPRIGTAMSAIFVAAIPLFSMLIAHAWGLEHLSRTGRLGLVLGLLGVVMLVGFPAVPVTPDFVLGSAACLAGVFSAALGTNIARRYLQHVGSMEQTIGAFLFGGLFTLPLLLVVPVPTTPQPVDFLYLLLLAGLVSAFAYVLYFRLVAEVGPTKAISVEFIVTVGAVVIGAALLGERLTILQIVGGAVIITGCMLVLGLLPPGRRARASREAARVP